MTLIKQHGKGGRLINALMFCISWSSSTAVTNPFSDRAASGLPEAAPEWPFAPALLSLLGLRPVMVILVLAPGSERPLLKVVSALGDEPRLLSGVPLPGPAGSNPISQVTSDAERLPMASAGAITAERSASLGSTTWSGISAGIDGATVSASPAFSTPSSAVTPAVSMLALVVAAAATVFTASRRELLADFALPHSQMHGLLMSSASATYSRPAFDTVS
ncbi:MAG: hypothetical protein FRX49_05913 [Trebouxia sp. A1-2]|nr:MAG: hypothetical protein FRX49_05913 [Trebouxia sp. A1-2]